jgi:hypothetical protein
MMLTLVIALSGCAETTTGPGNALTTSSTGETGGEHKKTAQLPKCERPLGTVALVEREIVRLRDLGLTQPTPLLRLMIAESGCFQVIDGRVASATGKAAQTDYYLSADILSQNENAGGFAGGLGKALPGLAGAIAGGINANVSDAQTALYLTNAKTSVQVAAATGTAQTTDVGFSTASLGRGFAAAGGVYSNTPIGKTVAASFLDAYAKLVAQVQTMAPLQAVAPPKGRKQAAAK